MGCNVLNMTVRSERGMNGWEMREERVRERIGISFSDRDFVLPLLLSAARSDRSIGFSCACSPSLIEKVKESSAGLLLHIPGNRIRDLRIGQDYHLLLPSLAVSLCDWFFTLCFGFFFLFRFANSASAVRACRLITCTNREQPLINHWHESCFKIMSSDFFLSPSGVNDRSVRHDWLHVKS